jgi:hypothetical protein
MRAHSRTMAAIAAGTTLVAVTLYVSVQPPPARAQPVAPSGGERPVGGGLPAGSNLARMLVRAGLSDRRLLAAGLDANQLTTLRANIAGDEPLLGLLQTVQSAETTLRQALALDRANRLRQPQDIEQDVNPPSSETRQADAAFRVANQRLREAILSRLPASVTSGLQAVDLAEQHALPLEFAPALTSAHQARQLQRALNREGRTSLNTSGRPLDQDAVAALAAARANPAVQAARMRLATVVDAPVPVR